MEALRMDNDTRGWIMCLISGIACVLGASIICVDLIIRMFPGKENFRIQDSNSFLACSLSLSFGVMIFMSLYSMLPESKSYLKNGGFSEQPAGFILMGCFIGGFAGIQVISRLFHQLLPSHVVDCDHSHGEQNVDGHSRATSHSRRQSSRTRGRESHHSYHSTIHSAKGSIGENGRATESTPLLSTETPRDGYGHGAKRTDTAIGDGTTHGRLPRTSRSRASTQERRQSMIQVPHRVLSFVKDTKPNCDESGPCFGYSDPCGQECFKHLSSRSAVTSRASTFLHTTTNLHVYPENETPCEDDNETTSAVSPSRRTSRAHSRDPHHAHFDYGEEGREVNDCDSMCSGDLEAQHHHHVAENAFLSIGLQTSIAIALHKLPEGFITYATNHANPSLGFNVFLALFVHNVSEGFALALPLYMALESRGKAMLWASVLGGLSQPLGAAIAVMWFKIAKRTHMTPDAVAYGCLFAITAGIMASVALQLFVESLSLNHNRNLSILFAFLGMALLGFSNAFTSDAH
ncbi:ZIP zinc transporter [Pseudomassariella vexata]|uniref:ZIP zinc transporter n=1 Tax=Pseudomassariella vexata TaxID=1141098 RepID=A0A1Y2EDS2_9PEZI|nr:ZIP zinc transporter [Pseudomassariella vexata]ORY69728.1 ZIP zinc transporter [Pseudomassariella vexata]